MNIITPNGLTIETTCEQALSPTKQLGLILIACKCSKGYSSEDKRVLHEIAGRYSVTKAPSPIQRIIASIQEEEQSFAYDTHKIAEVARRELVGFAEKHNYTIEYTPKHRRSFSSPVFFTGSPKHIPAFKSISPPPLDLLKDNRPKHCT